MGRVKFEMPVQFSFSTSIVVRITDINYGGHLGNDSLLSILHEARVRFLQNIGCKELDACGVSLIMTDAAIVYKGEAFGGDELFIQMAAGDINTRGFTLFYKVTCTRDGKILQIAEAQTGILCFNYTIRKVMSMPRDLREKLTA